MPPARSILLLAGAAATLMPVAEARACTVSAIPVEFGTYEPQAGAPVDGVGTIRLSCAPNVRSPTVSLGRGSSGSYSPRSMANGASRLSYNLYTDATHTSVWGDGTAGTANVPLADGPVNKGERIFTRTIYGRMPASQNVRAGTYSDTMIITVSF